MDRQQLMDEVFSDYSEWLEHDLDGTVLTQILTGLLLRERERNEVLKAELKRCKFAGVA
jgi:hypothetical protein